MAEEQRTGAGTAQRDRAEMEPILGLEIFFGHETPKGQIQALPGTITQRNNDGSATMNVLLADGSGSMPATGRYARGLQANHWIPRTELRSNT